MAGQLRMSLEEQLTEQSRVRACVAHRLKGAESHTERILRETAAGKVCWCQYATRTGLSGRNRVSAPIT